MGGGWVWEGLLFATSLLSILDPNTPTLTLTLA